MIWILKSAYEFVKNYSWNTDKDCVPSVINLGSIAILAVVIFLSHGRWMFFHLSRVPWIFLTSVLCFSHFLINLTLSTNYSILLYILYYFILWCYGKYYFRLNFSIVHCYYVKYNYFLSFILQPCWIHLLVLVVPYVDLIGFSI